MIKFLLKIFAKKQMEIARQEVEIWRTERLNVARTEILDLKLKYTKELEDLMKEHTQKVTFYHEKITYAAQKCADDMRIKEHDFHTEEAERRATIKILDKQIELLEEKHRYIQEIIDAEDRVKSSMMLLLNEKQQEIEKLTKALDKFIN